MSLHSLSSPAFAQDPLNALHPSPPLSSAPPEPQRLGSTRTESMQAPATPSPSAALYRQLREVKLDPKRVYHIREASIEREDVHITIEDGTIAFTEPVEGQITGAFFVGDAEVLVIPPDRVERRSLALFTQSAVLEEKFTSAFLRFNDDTAAELEQSFRGPADNAAEFVAKWGATVRSLAESDALRLLVTFLNSKRTDDGRLAREPGDRMLRARIAGTQLGIFDLFFDTKAFEQITVGQVARADSNSAFFNTWLSFPMRSRRINANSRARIKSKVPAATGNTTRDEQTEDRVRIASYKINTDVRPPEAIDCDAQLTMDVLKGGDRVVFFELSRFLKVSRVEAAGVAMEFLQNEALEGSALARRGNDLVAVVFPKPLETGQQATLHFTYSGSVLSDAGGGLMYVGARGIWFPNRGPAMANFDLTFRSPKEWTLVATGKHIGDSNEAGQVVSHWVSERPMPLAGFNLGHYTRAVAKTGSVTVEAYATSGMENEFPRSQPVVATAHQPGDSRRTMSLVVPNEEPTPARNAQSVANRVANAVDFLSHELGGYPYSSLTLSQMPGGISQGWPSLVFLSSYSFLSSEERRKQKMDESMDVLFGEVMPVHEAAHQWWGDLVGWRSYRDQWIVEALANYCALLALERTQPRDVQLFLNRYRQELLRPDKQGRELSEAGPVTLGLRLYSSYFPAGYDVISYGRGTWMFHMLRHMLRDGEMKERGATPMRRAAAKDSARSDEEPFLRVLRKMCVQYQGKAITNADVQRAFEEELPTSLRFEGRKSLDWFFGEWVNGTAIPRIELSGTKIAGEFASGKIVQAEAPDELITSVPLYAVVAGRDPVLLGRVFADGPETAFHVSVPAGTKKILLDPKETVLRRP